MKSHRQTWGSASGVLKTATLRKLEANLSKQGIAVVNSWAASNVFGAQTPPLPSPSSRFQVVADADKVIRYTCTGGVLTRQAGCSLATPSVCPDAGVTLAGGGGISASCTIDLTTTALVRNAMLSVQLTLTDSVGGESVTLVEQLRVDNTP